MADYQSLLTRAVANLPNATVAARRAIYDRARAALVNQLRSLNPPLPDADIEREERALDEAIAQVELHFGALEEASVETKSAPAHPYAPLGPSSANREPKPPAAPAVPRRPAPPAAQPSAVMPSRPPSAASLAQIPQRPATRPTTPTAQAPPTPPSSRSPGPSGQKPAPESPATVPPAASSAAKPPPVRAAPQRDAATGHAPPVSLAETGDESAAVSNLDAVVPNAREGEGDSAGAPPVTADLGDDDALTNVAPLSSAQTVPVSSMDGQRPSAPTPVAERRPAWPWIALALVLGVVLSIAAAAIVMRQRPQDLAIAPPPKAQQETPQNPAKIAKRAEPAPVEDNTPNPASPPPSTPTAQPQTSQGGSPDGQAATPQAQQAPDQLPTTGRAAMLIASPDNPQKPVVNLGSTVWSTIPPAPGQPATVAVKAEADIPDLKMHATMVLRKNTDPTLEASHTIDLKFAFAEGAPVTGFKDVGLPQMRRLDSTASETLNSVKVKISDDYFLVALAKSDQDLARNLDLMKTRAWFDFPLLLNDDRIAKLVFQKSADGEAMLEKAFEAWK
jgi:hypothetical protein